MSKEIKLIPELRFPEFVSEGRWNNDLLGDLVDIKGRIGYRGYTTTDIVKKGEGAITLSPSNFDENGNLNFEKCTYISWGKYEESPEIQLEEGQTVLVKTASVGKTAYVKKLPEKATVNPQIVVLKPKKIHNRFLAFSIAHHNIQNQISNCVGAGAIPNLSQESISNFELLIPPDKEKKEQQKIASCLSSLVELIAAHNDKLQALKDHKKGLMQNLFPQEGEKVPKFRFPEFEEDGEWVENKLNEFLELLTDFEANGSFADVKKNVNVYDAKNYAWYVRATDLENKSDLSKVKYIDEHSYNFLHKTKLFGGELLITKRGEIGKVFLYKSQGNLYATVAPNMYLVKLNKKAIPQFFYYHFMNFRGNHSLIRLNASSTIGALYKDDVKNLSLFAPPSIREQQKIASCLSTLDELIAAQSINIEQLQQHKKGLMQGLFPKIDK